MYQIRVVERTDYEQIATIATLIKPEPVTAEEMWDADESSRNNPEVHFTRVVAAAPDGHIAGYGFAEHVDWDPAERWVVYAAVHPQERRQGAGQAIYAACLAMAREAGGRDILVMMSGSDDVSAAWAEKRGFALDRQRTESVLDLTTWDPARFSDAIAKVEASGIRLTLADAREFPDSTIRQVYELDQVTSPDIPAHMEGETFPSWENYLADWRSSTDIRRIALAWDGDRVVGMSDAYLPKYPGKGAFVGYTAVLREYRGRTIALALKVMAINEAQRYGAPRMRTHNDPENAPMLAVNVKLGFQFIPGPKRYRMFLK